MSKKDKMLRDVFDYVSSFELGDGDKLNEFMKFWFKSYNHWNITTLLASAGNEEDGFSFEKICQMYPHRLAGRTTILSILNEGNEKNFYTKVISTKDHRRHNYKLDLKQKAKVNLWMSNNPLTKI